MSQQNKNYKKTYLIYTLMAIIAIGSVATIQQIFFYGGMNPKFYMLPLVVALLIGSLLGHAGVLKKKLRYKSDQFRAIADLAIEFTYIRNIDGHYEYVSPSCLAITGYNQQEFYQQSNLMDQLIHPDDLHLWSNHVHHINEGGIPQTLDIRLTRKDGKIAWISHLCSPVFDDDGEQQGVRSTNMDITRRKQYEEQFRRMAYFDPLTDLPNRHSLEEKLQEHISENSTDNVFALFFLDLSRFKNINDSFGHSFGDRLLIEIAQRLTHIQENLFISRFGGDEFVLLSPSVKNDEQALAIAKQIIKDIEKPLDIEGVELYVSGSIGIALYPRDGKDPDTLISRADAAMYTTKGNNNMGAEIYSASVGDQVKHFISTEQKIYKGIKNAEFEAFYQPKISLSDERIVGMEALIRWNHPTEGMIMPGDFIHIAEETGQITELGQIVFNQVKADLDRWHSQAIAVPIAINISARQFSSQQYCDSCMQQLQNLTFNQNMLELEVTEQVFLGDLEHAKKRLQAFRDHGVSIALDDFGTGYSSLNYLKQLPINTLKIDISFVRDLAQGNRTYAILKSILAMSRDLGLNAVAEGVETEQQKLLLQELSCEVAQGYLFHKPMPVADIERLLLAQK